MSKVVFAYGSLLSSRSRKTTLREDVPGVPAMLSGYRRVWNMRSMQLGGGITFLGLEEDSDSRCNGILFSVNDEQFERLRDRENGYEIVEIPEPYFDLYSGADLSDFGQAYTFQYLSGDRPDADYPIVQSYLDICLEGCFEIDSILDGAVSGDTATQFIECTEGWSRSWVNDRVHARRPFVDNPFAGKIDSVLRAHLEEYIPYIKISP